MANESEKSEPKDKDCPVTEPIHAEMHALMARHCATLITNGVDKTLDDAVAHVGGHMLRWMVTALFTFHRENPVQVAQTLLGMLDLVATDAGLTMKVAVIGGDDKEATDRQLMEMLVARGKAN